MYGSKCTKLFAILTLLCIVAAFLLLKSELGIPRLLAKGVHCNIPQGSLARQVMPYPEYVVLNVTPLCAHSSTDNVNPQNI